MDKESLIYICDQAKLEYKDEDLDGVLGDVNKVLESLESLDELTDKNMEMLEIVTDKDCEFREDEVKDSLRRSLALSNTDLTEYGYFKIDDKVVEDE